MNSITESITESIPQWILNLGTWLLDTAEWWSTGIFGVVVYWLPVIILLIHYSAQTYKGVQDDRRHAKKFDEEAEAYIKAREQWVSSNNTPFDRNPPQYFYTHTTIGHILGKYFVAFVPAVNLFLAVTDSLGEVIEAIANKIIKIFKINIVKLPDKILTK